MLSRVRGLCHQVLETSSSFKQLTRQRENTHLGHVFVTNSQHLAILSLSMGGFYNSVELSKGSMSSSFGGIFKSQTIDDATRNVKFSSQIVNTHFESIRKNIFALECWAEWGVYVIKFWRTSSSSFKQLTTRRERKYAMKWVVCIEYGTCDQKTHNFHHISPKNSGRKFLGLRPPHNILQDRRKLGSGGTCPRRLWRFQK